MCRTSPAWSWLVCSTRTSTPQSRASSRNRSCSVLSSTVSVAGTFRTTFSCPTTDRSLSTSSPRPGWAIPRWCPPPTGGGRRSRPPPRLLLRPDPQVQVHPARVEDVQPAGGQPCPPPEQVPGVGAAGPRRRLANHAAANSRSRCSRTASAGSSARTCSTSSPATAAPGVIGSAVETLTAGAAPDSITAVPGAGAGGPRRGWRRPPRKPGRRSRGDRTGRHRQPGDIAGYHQVVRGASSCTGSPPLRTP